MSYHLHKFTSVVPVAGALPSSFCNLTSLSNLHLEATAITALPNNLFSSLKAITTLTLVRNPMMGSLPSTLTQLSLKNLSGHFSSARPLF